MKEYGIYTRVESWGGGKTLKTRRLDIIRLSDWLPVGPLEGLTPEHDAWGHVRDDEDRRPRDEGFDPAGGVYCEGFQWDGYQWALDRFVPYGSPWSGSQSEGYRDDDEDQDDPPIHWLNAWDGDGDLYHPLLIEFDETGENVRVFRAWGKWAWNL